MRVICPNCDRKGLIDAGSLPDLASPSVCPRCAIPFRAVAPGFESATATTAATHAPASPSAFTAPRATAPQATTARAFIVEPLRAPTRHEKEDVLALPRSDTRSEARANARKDVRVDAGGDARAGAHEEGARVVLNLDGGLFARELRARPRVASDNYSLAVRLMNVSPLWMLAACAGFFALVFVFDLLLTPAPRAGGDPYALASMNNQATNRAARRAHEADVDQSDEPAAESARDADETRTGYDEAAPAGADAQVDRDALRRAPVSDAPTARADTATRAAGVSFANASEERPVDAGVESQALSLTIQLGSFRIATEAEAQAGALRAAGFDARVEEQRNSKRPWYCVQTGLFGAREDAERHLAELRAKGFAASYTLKEIR